MLRILLIDDNFDDQLSITRQLEQEFSPIEVTSIIHAKTFEEALAAGHFDIVITDYCLRWTNGLKILKTIKAKYPKCPVIMYTDNGNEEVAVLAMKSGLSDYVLKGRLWLLIIAIRESLEKRTLLHEYAVAVERLQISEERLELAMKAAHLGTWDWNMVTGQVIWSENHEQLFGLPLGSFLGNYEAFLACVHPEDRETITQAINHALKTKTDYNKEFRVVWSDGSVHWILGKGNFYYNKMGKPVRMIGVVLDITEGKQREEELEQANRLKDEFLAIVSHELRTPLNAILGWAQLLRSRNFDEATRNHSLEIIERSAFQQNQLINDILDTSRLMRGQMHLCVSPINLVSVIENALNTIQLSAQAKSITLEPILETSVAVVMGDENRLHQIIWNLLSNAIKFTPSGGRVEVRLLISAESNSSDSMTPVHSTEQTVSSKGFFSSVSGSSILPYASGTAAPNGNVRREQEALFSETSARHRLLTTQYSAVIQVSDTGEGISPEFLPHVFDHFRQADSTTTRSNNGLGLGLAIVRQLVELHGGTVAAESQGKGKGATLTVKLPLLEMKTQEPKVSRIQTSHHSQLHDVQILVVDDDTSTLELLKEILQGAGAKVVAVTSASAALQVLEELKFDILISDIGMPHTSGYALIHQLRLKEVDQTQRIPAIALTAYSREEDRIEALKAGFHIFLPKPVNTVELIGAISSLLE